MGNIIPLTRAASGPSAIDAQYLRSRRPFTAAREAQWTLAYVARPNQTWGWSENVLQNWCGANGEELVDQWMGSFPHRVNLRRASHTHLGVGAAVAENNKLYATQNFIRMR